MSTQWHRTWVEVEGASSKRYYGSTTPAVMPTFTAGTNLVTTTCTGESESAMHVDSIHT